MAMPKKGAELIEEIRADLANPRLQRTNMARRYWLGYAQALYDTEYIDRETFTPILRMVVP